MGATSRGIPLPAAVASARGGDERSDWTPRAAVASGHPGVSPRTMLSFPPPALLVDAPLKGKRSVTPPSVRDPAAKALERSRLRQLVNEFTQEACSGRSCTVVMLDSDLRNGGVRREARYSLNVEVNRFVLHGRAPRLRDPEVIQDESEFDEPLGQWPMEAVLGVHRAEDSALVQSLMRDLSRLVSQEELPCAAVLEFGGGAFANCTPLLLIEESVDHCERFVSGMQILRLYKGAAQRLESARNSGRSGGLQPGLLSDGGADAPSGGAPNPERSGSSKPRPLGAVGRDDDPASDGQPRETV